MVDGSPSRIFTYSHREANHDFFISSGARNSVTKLCYFESSNFYQLFGLL